MPQIWLTYHELAALIDCPVAAASAAAAAFPLDRRRSRDGRTRAKLNAALTEIFLDRMSRERVDRYAAPSPFASPACGIGETSVAKLRSMHAQMARFPVKALPAPGQSRA